jgi:hypothetical protein
VRTSAIATLALAAVCAARPVAAASFLYVRGEPGEGVTRGRQYLVRDTEGFDAQGIFGAVRFILNGGGFWLIDVSGPNGVPPAAGVYENATRSGDDGHPRLSVSGDGIGCNESTGRFVVQEADYDETGRPLAFSMEFEQRCEGSDIPLVGVLRYRAGDASCSGMLDGTPCDDRDPCTTNDVCSMGTCAGSESGGGECPAGGACLVAGICDRLTGTCALAAGPDGVACDDGDACSTGDRCLLGACVSSGEPPVCDDGSACTTDRCDPARGCVFDPVPGICWVSRPVFRAVGSGSAYGRTAICTLACRSPVETTLILGDDGSYRVPGVERLSCPSGQAVTIPDEVGVTEPRRRGRLALHPTNQQELQRAALECLAGSVQRLPKGRGWVRPASDGRTLTGVSRLHGKVRAQIPVTVSVVARLNAVRGLTPDGTPVPAPISAPRLPECSASVRPRCDVD